MFSRTVLVLIFLLSTAYAHAAPLSPASDGFFIRSWQVEEGLPQNTVKAILQTQDGYLWIGTYGGLARFDGEKFKNFHTGTTPGLQDNQIVSLYEDAAATLWIGHASGAVTCYRAGHFEPSGVGEIGAGRQVAGINADSSGAVWIFPENGIWQRTTDGLTLPAARRDNSTSLTHLVRDACGTLYFSQGGELARLVDGKREMVHLGPVRHSGFVTGVSAAAGGGLWLVRDLHVRKWQDHRWVEDRGTCPWGNSSITAMRELADGTLAVGTIEQGCYLLHPDGRVRHFDASKGLSQNWVRCLFEDREGNLWLGVGTGGLAMIKPTAFSVLNAPDHWQGHTVLSVAAGRDGALWIGTEGAGLYKYQRGEWTHFGREQGVRNPYVWSLAEDAAGSIWAGTWNDGVYRLNGDRFHAVPFVEAGGAPVIALEFNAQDQTLLAGVGTGLLERRAETSRWLVPGTANAITYICAIERDPAGRIWFGMAGGGLGRLDGGKLTVFRKEDGLPSNHINCLRATADGALWIGTADAGLSRFQDGRFATIGVKEGLASDVICHIADDGQGHLWLSTHHGIQRLTMEALHRCADGQSANVEGQRYDRSDGLPTLEYSGGLDAAGCQTTDGRLWFTSSKGLVSVDPALLRPNPTPPPVAFETLLVDGAAVTPNVSAELRLPPDHQRLEFQFTALSFVAPGKVRFNYRLTGLDRDWVEAGGKRSAFYSRLPAGKYSFQVIACNNDGVWNTTGATFTFSVRPFFWQTGWFIGLVGFAAAGAIAAAVRHETRRRLQRHIDALEREHAIERERTRIAQDIHDDIGASLTRITLLSQCGAQGPATLPQVAGALEKISETARDVTRSFEEIVWAIAPRHDTLESFVCYMAKFSQEFLSAAQVRCRLDLPVRVPDWILGAEIRHHLFLAFKEALNNAVKHSAASEVRVALRIEAHAFVLSVQDNGRGLDRGSHPPGAIAGGGSGHGLGNLQNRLARLGGRCEVSTHKGEGTTVLFTVFTVSPATPHQPLHRIRSR